MMLDPENLRHSAELLTAEKRLSPFAAITPETIEAKMRICDSRPLDPLTTREFELVG